MKTINRPGTALAGAPLLILVAGSCLFVTLEFLIIGLLPLLTHSYARSPEALGSLVTVFALSASIAGPLATLYLSRFSAPFALSLCLALAGLSSMLMALTSLLPVAMCCRVIQGALLTAYISLASSHAASLVPAGQRGHAVGQINFGVVIGLVAVIPAGIYASQTFGWQSVFSLLAIFCLLLAVLARRLIPKQNAALRPQPPSFLALLFNLRFILHLLLSLLLFTSMFISYSYISPWLVQLIGLPEDYLAMALFVFGLVGLVGNWVASSLVEKMPLQTTIHVTLLLGASLLLLSSQTAPVYQHYCFFYFGAQRIWPLLLHARFA